MTELANIVSSTIQSPSSKELALYNIGNKYIQPLLQHLLIANMDLEKTPYIANLSISNNKFDGNIEYRNYNMDTRLSSIQKERAIYSTGILATELGLTAPNFNHLLDNTTTSSLETFVRLLALTTQDPMRLIRNASTGEPIEFYKREAPAHIDDEYQIGFLEPGFLTINDVHNNINEFLVSARINDHQLEKTGYIMRPTIRKLRFGSNKPVMLSSILGICNAIAEVKETTETHLNEFISVFFFKKGW